MKTYAYLFLAAAIVSACTTTRAEMGANSIAARDALAGCTSDELVFGLELAVNDESRTHAPAQVADGVIERCAGFFEMLEISLVEDGEDPELARRVADSTRNETREQLIAVLSTD